MKANQGFTTADEAVTDVLGSILLVAITVSMMVGLAIGVLTIDGPSDKAHADIHFDVAAGTVSWGTGDEVIRMSHRGGEAIDTQALRLVISIGSTSFEYGPSDFDGDLADGKFSIGESWSRLLTIQENDVVKGTAIFEGRTVITRATLRDTGVAASCAADTTEPSIFSWLQQPGDVTTLTSTDVTVAVTIVDDCSGVDQAVTPQLEYWLDANPPVQVNMTLTGPGQWAGTIPQPSPGGWTAQNGKTLHYQVVGYQDKAGNVGSSPTQNDFIGAVDPNQYVVSYTSSQGNVQSFSNAQGANGLWATLSESDGDYTFYARDSTGSSVADHADARYAPNGSYAQMDNAADLLNTFDFDITGASGSIVDVKLVIVTQKIGVGDDQLQLGATIAGVSTNGIGTITPGIGINTYEVSIFTSHPDLVTGWGWSDVQQLNLRAEYLKVGGIDATSIQVDAMYAVVTTAGAANSLDVEFQWNSLIPAGSHTLEIRYQALDDAFDVQVWDHSSFTWVTRGTLSNASWETWSYVLTTNETSSAPEVRFVDQSGAAPAGTLNIDFARVVSS